MRLVNVGDKIKMRVPGSQLGEVLCHVHAVLTDPDSNAYENMIIVFRYWSKYRKKWYWKAIPYWELDIYNGWDGKYSLDDK